MSSLLERLRSNMKGKGKQRMQENRAIKLEAAVRIEQIEKGYTELSKALSMIDYLCGEPNDMKLSGYDVHKDPDLVVKAVKIKLKALQESSDG